MKIAIVGGTGFIGRPIVERLAASGHELLVLSRHPQQRPTAANVQSGFFDAMQPPREGLLRGFEAVIHLAGESIAERWTPAHKQRVLLSRQQGTNAIARAAVEVRTVRALVTASAIGYYGPHGSEELTEDSPPGDDFLAHVCRIWEDSAWPARAKSFFRMAIWMRSRGNYARIFLERRRN